jgi:CelD/BcsL family acetyltransferase involved in cellulose biosynthesis
MAVSLDGGFESYWLSRSRKLVQNIGRYERRVGADGLNRKFCRITALQDIGPAVARYAALESQGWKSALGTAITLSNNQGAFYSALMSRFAQDGDAMVFELWLDHHHVASRLVIRSGAMIVMLKTTYDETYSKYSPGRLLLHDAIQSLFSSNPGKVVEFYTDANADLLTWATGQRYIKHASLYRSALTADTLRRTKQLIAFFRDKGIPDSQINDHLSVSAYRHPDEFPPAVQQLFAKSAVSNVECSAQWFQNLINTVFSDQDGVRIYVLSDRNRPAAALPILVRKGAMGNTVEALGNYYTALYAPLLTAQADEEHITHLIAAIKAAHAPVRSMRFAPMDPASASYGALFNAMQASGLTPFKFFCFGNWYQTVESDWQTYLKNRDGAVRSTLRRMSKKFAAENGKLEMNCGGASLERGLAAYQQVYSLSWKQAEPYSNFVPGLVRFCAQQGWLRLGVAWLNGKPIAAQIWIVANGKANIYKLAHDEEFVGYAPGTLLTAMLMEHVIDVDKVNEIDYLIGDDAYKKAWMSHRRERWGLVAYNPKSIGGPWSLVKEATGRALKTTIANINARTHFKPITASFHANQGEPKRMTISSITWKNLAASDLTQDASLSRDWDRLNAARGNLPFLSSDAVASALTLLGHKSERLLVGYSAANICAMFILVEQGMFRWCTFQPSQMPLGAWVADVDIQLPELTNSLMRGPLGFCLILSITQIDPNCAPRYVDIPAGHSLDYIDTGWIDIEGSFDDYWAARGKNLRQNLRKQRTKLAAENTQLTMQVLRDHADMAPAVARYGSLESSGWKAQSGTAIHPNNSQGRFYRELLERASLRGEAVVYQYLFDERVVAMNLCLLRDGVLVVLKTTYDESIKSFSPAFLLREEELQEIFGDGKVKRIEYFGRLMDWHTKLTDKKRTLYHFTSYRWPFIKRIALSRRHVANAESDPKSSDVV